MSLLDRERKAEERDRSLANERAKLSANYMNGLALAVIVVGGITPVITTAFDHSSATDLAVFGLRLVGCTVASGLIHWRARDLLKDLR